MQAFLTAVELAQRLRVQPQTIRGWVRQGRIPVIRLSAKALRFDWGDVMAALKRHGSATDAR